MAVHLAWPFGAEWAFLSAPLLAAVRPVESLEPAALLGLVVVGPVVQLVVEPLEPAALLGTVVVGREVEPAVQFVVQPVGPVVVEPGIVVPETVGPAGRFGVEPVEPEAAQRVAPLGV